MKNNALNILISVFSLLLLSGCKTLHLKESDFLNPNNTQLLASALPKSYQFEQLSYTRGDGTQVYGIHANNPENQITVMYFGGNKFDVKSKGGLVIEALSVLPVNIVMFDHRGYGGSTGVPTLKLLMSDAIENFDYAKNKVTNTLILHGHSLGSFEAAAVAEQRPIDALILESTATHIDEWAKSVTPWYVRPFIKFKIEAQLRSVNNQEVVKQFTQPLLLLVGKNDKITPAKLSKKLFKEALSKEKNLHIFPQGDHTNLKTQNEYTEIYANFLSILAAGPGQETKVVTVKEGRHRQSEALGNLLKIK